MADRNPILTNQAEYCDVRVREEIAARNLQEKLLGADLMHGPSWDLLLELYAAHGNRRPITVTVACESGRCPVPTALRYLDKMEIKGLVIRNIDSADRRRKFVRLTPKGIRLVDRYFFNCHHSSS